MRRRIEDSLGVTLGQYFTVMGGVSVITTLLAAVLAWRLHDIGPLAGCLVALPVLTFSFLGLGWLLGGNGGR